MSSEPAICAAAMTCDPPGDTGLRAVAQRLAEEIGLPMAHTHGPHFNLLLVLTPDRLELRWRGRDERGRLKRLRPTAVDLTVIDGTSPLGRSLKQPIARAVGLHKGDPYRPVVFDATAGYGEDAWLLASLGCRVIACERSAVMTALLADGLRRARQAAPDIADRIELHHGQSIEYLRQLEEHCRPDVVYLDPMFPVTGKSAAQRRPMWLLRKLVGEDADADALFDAAMAAATRRVVVKRPLHAEPIAGRKPVAMHKGKAQRYDIYPIV
jgi:16S rRNA (guanine1516-N2)-methyltransferase